MVSTIRELHLNLLKYNRINNTVINNIVTILFFYFNMAYTTNELTRKSVVQKRSIAVVIHIIILSLENIRIPTTCVIYRYAKRVVLQDNTLSNV